MSINPQDCAFCQGPGMGLFQFKCMPFELTGALQKLMNQLLRDVPFVTVYIDDILVHSVNQSQHAQHFHQVFSHLSEANLTLRDRKCHIALSQVSYLGRVFSAAGMSPDPQKVSAMSSWKTPTTVEEIGKFIGLASYYHRYIEGFSDITKPLHKLTQKQAQFVWSDDCHTVFNPLKEKLVQAPILAYPHFDQTSPVFVLQTDVNSVGVGAILEQGGHVIAYSSRILK